MQRVLQDRVLCKFVKCVMLAHSIFLLWSSKPFTWQVVALQLTLQQNGEQEDCPSNMAHQPHCTHEFWKAAPETEWSVQFYWWTLVDTSACDLRGTQDLLMKPHVTEQQPVKKEKSKCSLSKPKDFPSNDNWCKPLTI